MVSRKRKAAVVAVVETPPPATTTSSSSRRRRSQRIESSSSGLGKGKGKGTKSLYFEGSEDSESDGLVAARTNGGGAKSGKSKSQRANGGPSGRKAKRVKKVESDDDDDEDAYQEEPVDDDDDDEDEDGAGDGDEDDYEDEKVESKPKKRVAAAASAQKRRRSSKKVEPKNQVVDEDEDDEEEDEDAPPKVKFIPIPKLRDTDGVEYADDKLHKNTLAFLKDLRANNKRAWLKSHDGEYRRSLKDWESYVTSMTEKIIELDPTVPELPFKDVNFRIYRDIRFSNDPTPYKPHYAAAWSRTGRKGPYACYYIHAEPGKSFIGGGLWHPDGEAVQRLRASIDERPERWRRALTNPVFVRTFFPDILATTPSKTKTTAAKKRKSGSTSDPKTDDNDNTTKDKEKAILAAFAAANAEGALKTKPKGFLADHRDIELLKLRNFTVGKKIPDSVFTTDDGQDELAGTVEALVGFVTHLNRIVRPDPGNDDDSEEDGEDDEDDE